MAAGVSKGTNREGNLRDKAPACPSPARSRHRERARGIRLFLVTPAQAGVQRFFD
jgi:hypothetical protein